MTEEGGSETDKRRIAGEAMQPGASGAEVARRYGIDRRVLRRWKQELAALVPPQFVTVQITDTPPRLAPNAAETAS